jgi:hypothetical protein
VEIDPARIEFIQFPEFHKLGARAPSAAGDWDRVLDRPCFWGARYEGGRGQDTGMVPLTNYRFLQALRAHFDEGVPWAETEWLQWMTEKGPSRYNSEAKIGRRLQFLEQLYADCRSGAYRFDAEEPPLVNIGREGRIAIEDGRHRICVAKAARLPRILVEVNAVHPEA